jgi:Uma2 family endonuclease
MSETALKRLTFDEAEALEDRDGVRYELWHGQLVAMTGGTSAHNQIALDLREHIKGQSDRRCLVYAADMALKLNPGSYGDKAYPDVMLVCDPLEGTYQTDPVLVAEVISESSVTRDRNDKFKAYTALASIQVYLILSQTAVEIEVYRRATDWACEIYRGSDIVELQAPALRLSLPEIYDSVWNRLTGGA